MNFLNKFLISFSLVVILVSIPFITKAHFFRPAQVLDAFTDRIEFSDSMVTSPKLSAEEISDVSESISTLNKEAEIVDQKIRAEIKSGIDASIIEIVETENIPAYQLQSEIDVERNKIYLDISQTLTKEDPTDVSKIDALAGKVEESVLIIEDILDNQSDVMVDFSEKISNIEELIDEHRSLVSGFNSETISEKATLLFLDSDNDGVSDYDETFIFNTNPNDATTVPGNLTDGQKLNLRIDPTSKSGRAIDYEDIKTDGDAPVLEEYNVTEVTLENEILEIRGTALPNSFITLYIYSNPIIVTLKTDSDGHWQYKFDKELDNGTHEIYVTSVDNTGKVIAKSNATTFTKTAQAAVLGIPDIDVSDNSDFFKNNFILIIIVIVFLATFLTIMFIGQKTEHTKMGGESKNDTTI